MGRFVQYGCGLTAPTNWENYDVSPTLRVQKVPLLGALVGGPKFPKNIRLGDICKGLSLPDSCADAMYCSHTLEHLALEDLRIALRHTFRILKPGGVFRFVLPDLRRLAREYVESKDPNASLVFMEASVLGKNKRPRGLIGVLRTLIGNSSHLWMWDFESLSVELAKAGFVDIRRAEIGDSKLPEFKDVEALDRWKGELGMECRKPG